MYCSNLIVSSSTVSTSIASIARRCGRSIAILLSASLCMTAMALPSDRSQPLHIQSNKAVRDDSKGVTVYEGAVEIRQGTLKIFADKVTIFSEGSKIDKVEARGNPATYQQQPASNKQLVTAKGRTIRYFIDSEKLILLKAASIEQQGTTMSGERIDYDIRQSVVKAAGGQRRENQRIEMIYDPNSTE